MHHVVPLSPGGIRQNLRVALEQVREEPHVVRVVRDDEEIERAGELHRLLRRRGDLLPLGEAIRVAGVEAATERAGIHREAGVQMRVAEERSRWEVAPGVRRIRRLGGKGFLGRRLVERADVRRGWCFLGEGTHAKAGERERDCDFRV